MKMKICGMRDRENIRAIAALKPDYMGLIFYPGSKRYVEQADSDLLESLFPQIKVTGVFVNESQQEIVNKVSEYHLKAVQLHGQETAEYCTSLQKALASIDNGIEMIKAFAVNDDFTFETVREYEALVDFFLFDTKTSGHGGSGLKFNWEILKNYNSAKPYFLSGGIGPDDLEQLMNWDDERFFAVDLNSKFEISPALKDTDKVSRAINIIKTIT